MRKYKKPYKTRYGEVMGEICDLNDILIGNSTNSVHNNGFEKYKPLYKNIFKRFKNHWTSSWFRKNNNKVIEKTMRRITKMFLDKMLKDLIYNNYEFVFPNDNCRLSIGYKTWTDKRLRTKFKYNMKTGGLTYVPRIVFSLTNFLKIKRLRYYISFSPKYNKMLMDEIIKNKHEYINSEHYDNSEQ